MEAWELRNSVRALENAIEEREAWLDSIKLPQGQKINKENEAFLNGLKLALKIVSGLLGE